MPAPTRRQLIGGSLGASGLLFLGGFGLALRPGANHPVPALEALDERAFRTLEAFARRVCPHDPEAGFPSADAIGVAKLVDTHVATMHETDRAELNQALWLLENALAGLFIEGRTRAFSVASADAQDRALAAWRGSSIGVLRRTYLALQQLCISSYYGHPSVYAAIGYPGPPDYGQADAPAIQPVQGVPT